MKGIRKLARLALLAWAAWGMAAAAEGAPGSTLAERAAPFNPYSYDTEGWAQGTVGGRGGRILRVRNLNAAGPGSLREALAATGARTVVFEVGGVIDLRGQSLRIDQPYVTVAGQTAPAPGITLIKGGIGIAAHQVIVQHLMIRPGDDGRPARSGGDHDGIATHAGAHHVIVDHCSLSWATDENLSVSGPRFQGSNPDAWRAATSHAITYSYNLVYEGLSHSVHPKGEHSKGTLVHDNASGILLVGNLYASNRERNALFKGGAQAAMVNNLIYNPGAKAVHYNLVAHEWEGHDFVTGKLSLVGNVLRHGPDTRAGTPLLALGGHGDLELHLYDNQAQDANGLPVPLTGRYTASHARLLTAPEPPYLPPGLVAHPARSLERHLPLAVGARPWARDPVDFKLLSDVAEGRGEIINSERDHPLGRLVVAPTQREFVDTDWNLDTMRPKAGWASLQDKAAKP